MNSEKWFSWFWLIFWIIACLPMMKLDSIIYLLIRGDKIKGVRPEQLTAGQGYDGA